MAGGADVVEDGEHAVDVGFVKGLLGVEAEQFVAAGAGGFLEGVHDGVAFFALDDVAVGGFAGNGGVAPDAEVVVADLEQPADGASESGHTGGGDGVIGGDGGADDEAAAD